ncbi:MAG: glycosyltransferase [Deltaproteobacteria bacterium]|nr:glycosyltransferase [Deltaproteobacteria bacterium]
MADTPTISVVMSIYNEEKYVASAIQSILDQTFRDFEFIIIDDCSSDATPFILAAFAQSDARIRIIHNDYNLGLTRSLNIGLDCAQGEFIARMDADDISLPMRLEKQLSVFSEQPNIVLCGTATVHIDEAGRRKSLGKWPDDLRIIKWYSVFRPALAHPSAMFRREVLNQGLRYDETLKTAQDYDLFSRMQLYGDVTVLNSPLLLYRSHANNISNKKSSEQGKSAARICHDNLRRTFPAFFSKHGSQASVIIADFIHRETPLSSTEIATAVETICGLETDYLQTLTPHDKLTMQAIQRLTVRWMVQAVFQKREVSLSIRLRLLYELRHRLLRLMEESLRYMSSKVKDRV